MTETETEIGSRVARLEALAAALAAVRSHDQDTLGAEDDYALRHAEDVVADLLGELR
jgi:hypothetical protein